MSPRAQQYGWRALFSALAFVISMHAADRIFYRCPITSDENSYVFQANNFIDGLIARPTPPFPEAFLHAMIVIHHRAGWFSRYPPAHSLWLVPGVLLDDIRLPVAAAAALAMWCLCAAAAALGIAQALVAIPLLLSPYFIFMYGTHLSHTSGLAMAALMCWAYIRGQQSAPRAWMALAGLAWSFLFLNRTYTAMLMAIPFGIDALAVWAVRRSRDAFWRAALFAAAAAVGVALYLLYNRLATGDAFTATYLFYEPSEGLGFGPRRTQGIEVLHTPARGFRNFLGNLQSLNTWLFGFTGSLLAAAALAAAGWSRRWSATLLGTVVAVWIGYIAFWYPGIPNAGGPVYFFETLAPLLLLVGFGLQRLWNAHAAWPRGRWIAGAALVAALGATVSPFIAREAGLREQKQRFRRMLEDTIDRLPSGALVFFEKVPFPDHHELAFNPRGLESDRLRALSQYEDNVAIQRLFRHRPAFLIHGQQPLSPIPLPAPERVIISRDAHKFHHRTGRDVDVEQGLRVRLVQEGRDRADWIAFGRQLHVPAGCYRVRWLGECRDIDPARPTMVDITSRRGRDLWAETNFHGTSDRLLAEMTLTLTNAITDIEPRMKYGGSGDLVVRQVRIEEILTAP